MLRLIAELRRVREALEAVRRQPAEAAETRSDRDYTPPGGRVPMAEWQEIAARLEASRRRPRKPRSLAAEEREERQRQWEALRAQLDSGDQLPLSPQEEAEVNRVIREEIEAYRSEKRQASE